MLNPKVRLRVGHQHWQFWPILARFVDYYSLFWGPGVISTINEPWSAFTCRSSTIAILADSDPFLGLLLTVLGSQSDFHSSITPRCAYMSVMNIGCFGRFWPVSWTITQCFGVQEWFPWLPNPRVRLRVGRKHSLFWPILACFMDYYLLFWGPRVTSTINKPWGAFMCRSSTLAVLADSGPFLGLLLTVLGSRSDFHNC